VVLSFTRPIFLSPRGRASVLLCRYALAADTTVEGTQIQGGVYFRDKLRGWGNRSTTWSPSGASPTAPGAPRPLPRADSGDPAAAALRPLRCQQRRSAEHSRRSLDRRGAVSEGEANGVLLCCRHERDLRKDLSDVAFVVQYQFLEDRLRRRRIRRVGSSKSRPRKSVLRAPRAAIADAVHGPQSRHAKWLGSLRSRSGSRHRRRVSSGGSILGFSLPWDRCPRTISLASSSWVLVDICRDETLLRFVACWVLKPAADVPLWPESSLPLAAVALEEATRGLVSDQRVLRASRWVRNPREDLWGFDGG